MLYQINREEAIHAIHVGIRPSLWGRQDSGDPPAPTRQRILRHAEQHYAGKYARIEVRFRSQFCYIDAYQEPRVDENFDPQRFGITREQYLEQRRKTPIHLCRLRYFGREDHLSMAFFAYSSEKYEPCFFPNGTWEGTVEEAFDSSAIYLDD